MQKHLQKQVTLSAQHTMLCPRCGSELHLHWCTRCFGTGRSGKHECRKCGGTGKTIACPNVSSHKLNLFGWLFPKTGSASPAGGRGEMGRRGGHL
jgi:hypothetical protein